ncbi:MAG: hypothetical protein UX57_C0017G0007 [Candidatus Uhrbacteria bacterium GW2011_GWE2_46_68]|uniref:Uncharacterized protein n=2 Tax=Candidatus Uhriibacteriota TaxID=1752732 RepID=A0A0G1T4R3_9BACT|nr:MAG: hypothetical protein UX45_C0018G0007 [Candidatus Uhrbacteria bacterium GW2011_GWF2_46_218]KKU40415.1 MAG: hypothetical protein UX57_C0017G0007 [Candidatus Uhrbacteria bacterium GW2011_GWE2_46_68]
MAGRRGTYKNPNHSWDFYVGLKRYSTLILYAKRKRPTLRIPGGASAVRRRARSETGDLLHDHGGTADFEHLNPFGEGWKREALFMARDSDLVQNEVVSDRSHICIATVLEGDVLGPNVCFGATDRPCHGRGRRGRGRLPARHVERRLPRVFIISTGDLGDRDEHDHDEQTRGDDTSEPTSHREKDESGRHGGSCVGEGMARIPRLLGGLE